MTFVFNFYLCLLIYFVGNLVFIITELKVWPLMATCFQIIILGVNSLCEDFSLVIIFVKTLEIPVSPREYLWSLHFGGLCYFLAKIYAYRNICSLVNMRCLVRLYS